MLVRNNKTNEEHEISADTWNEMQQKGIAKRFSVVSNSSVNVAKKKVDVPVEVVNLRKNPKKNKTVE